MGKDIRSFDEFSVGDFVVFERSFTSESFAAFAALSGDYNPLHHDRDYAQTTDLGRPIVPLHLTLAPLSMVAGMIFPGEPSLYLGHEVRAILPVFYGETLRYSARVTAINATHRVLTLRVLALRESEVVVDATMRVQATKSHWKTPSLSLPIQNSSAPSQAVVTGASGEVGAAIGIALATRGWRLLLQDRGDSERRQRLRTVLERHNAEYEFCSADLSTEMGREALSGAAGHLPNVALVVHAASPPIDAPLDDLVSVNYSALRDLAQAVLPSMLARQAGTVLLIGSIAIDRALHGWEDYSAAKAMAAGFVGSWDRWYAVYGVRGLALLPGYIATRFSDQYRASAGALLPQEVAEAALAFAADGSLSSNVMALEVGASRRGSLGFHDRRETPPLSSPRPASPEIKPVAMTAPAAEIPSSPISDTVRRVLSLPGGSDLAQAALGVTAGWDSLRHIELLIEIERLLSIRFLSQEMEAAQSFVELDRICQAKLTARAAP